MQKYDSQGDWDLGYSCGDDVSKKCEKGYKQEGRDAMEDTFAKAKVSFAVLLKKI